MLDFELATLMPSVGWLSRISWMSLFSLSAPPASRQLVLAGTERSVVWASSLVAVMSLDLDDGLIGVHRHGNDHRIDDRMPFAHKGADFWSSV